MVDPKQVFDWLKFSGKQAFIMCVISTLMLFSSEEVLDKLGLINARDSLQLWIGLVWLLSVSILGAEILYPIYKWISQRVTWYFNVKHYQKRLHVLTDGEKRLLAQYIDGNTRTISVKYSDGVAKELESSVVIRRASMVAHYHDVFPYNIQPWAWEYLTKNPQLLK